MRRFYAIVALLAAVWPAFVLAQDGNGDGAKLAPDASVAMWGAIVGFLMPPVIAALNRRGWSSSAKAVCAFVACLIAAAATAFFAGDLDNVSDYATAALTVFGAAMVTFHQWWKPSGIAPKIENATG